MRLRSFTAQSMPAAIKQVRDALGENAIIIASESLGNNALKVTAAIEEMDEEHVTIEDSKSSPAPRKSTRKLGNDLRFHLQNTLRFHNLPDLFIAKMMQRISDSDLSSIAELLEIGGKESADRAEQLALQKLLSQMFDFNPLRFDNPPTRIMLVGAPGIGKTFTIAKMASRLAMDKKDFAVITTDNKRAGGIEQLQAYTDILQTKLIVATSQKELADMLTDIPPECHILIDTAGCNAYDETQMTELAELARVKSIEPILVMAAGGDSLEALDVVEPFSELPIERLLVTRADTARRFGGVLSAAAAYGFVFANISASSSIADNLQPADSSYLTQLLLQYQLQS